MNIYKEVSLQTNAQEVGQAVDIPGMVTEIPSGMKQ
jgi:hypothetical protein